MYPRLLIAAIVACCLLRAAGAAYVINEVLANPSGTDDDREFVELRSTTGVGSATNLTVLMLNGNGSSAGIVNERWNLNGLTFGLNGLLLLGNGYDGNPPGPWADQLSTLSETGDPTGFGDGDILNSTCTLLLVESCNASVTNGLDLDVTNNGILDSAPWAVLHDGVAWNDGGASDHVYASAIMTQVSGTMDAASRHYGNAAANTTAAWYSGDLLGTNALARTYDAAAASANLPAGARVTPGDLNDVLPAANADVRLNEVYANAPGSSDEREFVELSAPAGAATDLARLWLLVIDSQGSSNGVVSEAWNLTGLRTGTNGLILLGDAYDDPRGGPWSNHVAAATPAAQPGGSGSTGWGNGDISGDSTYTLLLVADFSAVAGVDLDTNDNLVLDQTPWLRIQDSLGWSQTYAQAAFNLDFSPDMAARLAGVATANSTSAWYVAEMTGSNLTVTLDTNQQVGVRGWAALTPGSPNYPIPLDTDFDGMPDEWESLYFGSATNAGSNGDADADGARNGEEYVAVTDPTNATSVLQIGAMALLLPASVVIDLEPTSPERRYDVSWRTNLTTGAWIPSGMSVTGSSGVLELQVPLSADSMRFLRPTVRIPTPDEL